MSESTLKTYCIDSSAFITINRIFSMGFLPDTIWTLLQKIFDCDRILSHVFVYEEICPVTKKPDFLANWLKPNKRHFCPVTIRQTQLVTKILSRFSSLINYDKEINEADPWVIALAIEKKENIDMFNHWADLTVVSNENERSSIKIPAVCKEFGIPHLNLKDFFAINDWKIKLEAKSLA